MGNIYPFSVFYFTKSVFDGVGKKDEKAIRLLLKSVLINTRFKERIGTPITFTLNDIIKKVSQEPYIENFKGFMALGKNMAYPESSDEIRGDINFKIVQFAINKDGDIMGIVKIVANDYETTQAIKKIRNDEGYPLGIVSCEQALEELEVIEKKLIELFD